MRLKTIFLNNKRGYTQKGSSLIGIALMILAVGFLITGGLYLIKNYDTIRADHKSVKDLRSIQAAISDFAAREGRYPCPAPLNAAPDTATYGKEGAANSCSTTVHTGTYRVSGTPGDNVNVRVGAVPVRSLNLSDELMVDGYGHRYVYAITENLAVDTHPVTGDKTDIRYDLGSIRMQNESGDSISDPAGLVVYALTSFGSDERGAFNERGILISPCEADTTTAANENCDFLKPGGDATFVSTSKRSFGVGADSIEHIFAFHTNNAPYRWYAGPWGECIGTCWEGNQTRTVECHDYKGGVVANSFCGHTDRPDDSRVCAMEACYWDDPPFGPCVGVCFEGEQTRVINCREPKNDTIVDEDEFCLRGGRTPNAGPKDSELQVCPLDPCAWVPRTSACEAGRSPTALNFLQDNFDDETLTALGDGSGTINIDDGEVTVTIAPPPPSEASCSNGEAHGWSRTTSCRDDESGSGRTISCVNGTLVETGDCTFVGS